MRSAEMWVPSNPNSPLSSLPPVHVHKSQSGHTDHYKFLGFCRVQVQVVVITPVCEMPDLISVGCFIIVLYHSYYCGTASKFDSVVGSVNEGADIRVDDFHPDILWSNCIKSWAEIHKEYSYMGGGGFWSRWVRDVWRTVSSVDPFLWNKLLQVKVSSDDSVSGERGWVF